MTTDADPAAAATHPSMPATRLAMVVARIPRRHLAAAAGAGIITATASIGLLATSAWLITRASERPPVFALAVAMGAVQAFALARGLGRYAERLALHGAALHALSRLRLWLFDVLEPLVPGGLPGRGAGAVLNGFVSDVDSVSNGLAKRMTTMIDVGSSTGTGVVLAAIVLPAGGGLLLSAAVALIIASVVVMRIARPAVEAASATRVQVAGEVVDIVHCAPELLMYGRMDLVDRRLQDLHARAVSASSRQALILGIARCIVVIASAAALMGVLLTGLIAHAAGHLSGVMLAVLVFVGLAVLDQVAVLPAALAVAAEGDAAARSVAALAATEPVVHEPPPGAHPARRTGTVALRHARVDPPHAPHGAPLLDDVSLRVRTGARVALVGRSGSGKSSVLHTLLHFFDTSSGSAIIDGADVRTMQRSSIAQRVAWMPETTHVFDATLSDNLRIARPSASDRDCVEALHRVGLGQWLATLPEGLQTRLGPVGRPLSAGERQRLGMARALLWDAPTLLLDEPTAHLDPGSRAHALNGLFNAAGRRPVLIVTHEPHIAEVVQQVMTLEDGRTTPGAVA